MPATSDAQRRAAWAALEGKGPMRSMSKAKLKHYAHTHGSLPETAKKAFDLGYADTMTARLASPPVDAEKRKQRMKVIGGSVDDVAALIGNLMKEVRA